MKWVNEVFIVVHAGFMFGAGAQYAGVSHSMKLHEVVTEQQSWMGETEKN